MKKPLLALAACVILAVGLGVWNHYHREARRIMIESAEGWTDRFAKLALFPFFEEHGRLPTTQAELEEFLDLANSDGMYPIAADGTSERRCAVYYQLHPSSVLKVVYEADTNGMRRVSSVVVDSR